MPVAVLRRGSGRTGEADEGDIADDRDGAGAVWRGDVRACMRFG